LIHPQLLQLIRRCFATSAAGGTRPPRFEASRRRDNASAAASIHLKILPARNNIDPTRKKVFPSRN
jgi:hypothetical protein